MPIFSALSPAFLSALCGSSFGFDFDIDSADFALGLLTSTLSSTHRLDGFH